MPGPDRCITFADCRENYSCAKFSFETFPATDKQNEFDKKLSQEMQHLGITPKSGTNFGLCDRNCERRCERFIYAIEINSDAEASCSCDSAVNHKARKISELRAELNSIQAMMI
jgi:hypothetical protein